MKSTDHHQPDKAAVGRDSSLKESRPGGAEEAEGPVPVGKRRWVHCAILSAVCALVIGVYAESATSGMWELPGATAANAYYNLLVQGFRAGQLNLKAEVPTGLAQLADPYNPAASAPYRWIEGHTVHDLSYYKGKLYLYFGVTPALVLFWPYAVLTGHYLAYKSAVVIFFSVGLLASVALLLAVWRRYFAEIESWVVLAGALALGLANLTPPILAWCEVHEVAISCGYGLTLLALLALWRALHDLQRSNRWLAAASLAYGLAVGARPSLLPGAVVLLMPVAQAWPERRRVWLRLLAAIGPIVLIGLGLMRYNALRFDSPFEFGQCYQLSSFRQSAMQQFSLGYLWFNIRVGFLEPAHWSGRFPFVHDIAALPLPRGYNEAEHPFGILTNIPLVWLALAAPLAWRDRSAAERSTLRWFLAVVALVFGIGALTVGLHNSMCLRYEVEFVSPLGLLAVIGILGLERALASQPVWRHIARWSWVSLLAFSVVFNLLASIARHAGAHNTLGRDLLQRGELVEAITHYHKALEIQPDNAEAECSLAAALLRRGQIDEAIAHFQRALKAQPDYTAAHNNLGNALLAKGELNGAIRHYQEALKADPNKPTIHNNLGSALHRQGRIEEAIVHFKKALEIAPDYAKAHNSLGNALLQQELVDEAITQYLQALKVEPGFAIAHNNLGIAFLHKRRVDEAIVQFQQALEIQPGYVQAHHNLGLALSQNGQRDGAIAEFRRALEIWPDFANVHRDLATALLQKGQVQEAMAHLQKALEIQPDDIATCNKTAWLLATCPVASVRNGVVAVALAQRADQLSRDQDPEVIGTLAAAYGEAGRFTEAIATVQRAIQLANTQSNTALANGLQAHLKLYQAGLPLRETAQTDAPVTTSPPGSAY